MKVLLDTCISPRTRAALAEAGHEAVWVGDWDSDPGDQAILESAQREARILTTHVGSLPRPGDLLDLMKAKIAGLAA